MHVLLTNYHLLTRMIFFELQHETFSSKLILLSQLVFLEKSKLREVILHNPNRAIKEKERSIFFIILIFFQK